MTPVSWSPPVRGLLVEGGPVDSAAPRVPGWRALVALLDLG